MNITAQETVLLKQCQGFLSRYCVEMTVSDDSAVFVGFAMHWRNIPASAVSQNVKVKVLSTPVLFVGASLNSWLHILTIFNLHMAMDKNTRRTWPFHNA